MAVVHVGSGGKRDHSKMTAAPRLRTCDRGGGICR